MMIGAGRDMRLVCNVLRWGGGESDNKEMRESRKLLLENNYRSHSQSFQRKIAQLHVEGWESVFRKLLGVSLLSVK